MLGFRPLATQPLATLAAALQTTTQTVTLRYSSESFVTRDSDVPASTFIPGRLMGGLTIGRRIVDGDDGQFGGLIESAFGEIELNNSDGALDALATDYFADGREIRLKIGAREVVSATRLMPTFIAAKSTASSGDAGSPWLLAYPDDSVLAGDFFIAQITINDRGAGGALSSVPAPWAALTQDDNGALHQAIISHVADGTEAGTTTSIDWESIDGANDVICGRIHQFRYVDPDTPIEGLVAIITGSLSPITLPTVITTEPNSLAMAMVSWSDNVDTMGPTGESGGDWDTIGDIVATGTADDAANRRYGAQMVAAGTITGGTIAATATDSPPSLLSIMRGFVLRGLPVSCGQERVQPFADFALFYTATAGSWSLGHSVMKLQIESLANRLQERLQILVYAGSGGENGTSDMAGRTKPVCFGRVLNVAAQLIDPAILTYQVHSGSIEAFDAVYDQGIDVPFVASPGGADYATYAALAAASVPGGSFSTCLAEGYFKLGATPTGTVTADVRGDNAPAASPSNYVDTHGGVIRRMILGYTPLTTADLDEGSFTALDTAQPAEMGIFFPAGDTSSINEAIDRVAVSGGIVAGDVSGLYQVTLLSVPATVQDWSFNDRTIIEIDRDIPPFGSAAGIRDSGSHGVPWKSWGVGYARNWTVQRSSELAAGVTQARRQFLESEFRYAFASSATIALAHRTSKGSYRDSLFIDQADALAEAQRLLGLYALGRAVYRISIKTALFSVRIGETVRLTYDRWNLASGRRFVVVGVADDAGTRVTELVLFG